MIVVVMRHGLAGEPSREHQDDRQRPLTPEGREKTRDAARGLKAMEIHDEVDIVLTSPLVRARETAEIAAKELGVTHLVETRYLAPGFDPAALLDEIRLLQPERGAIVVGHEPDMGRLVSWLLTGNCGAIDVPMKKAGAACIEMPKGARGGGGTLRWLATPVLLRAAGR